MCKIRSQKKLSSEKAETNYIAMCLLKDSCSCPWFTFQFMNGQIDQNTNFPKLPSDK